MMSYHLSPENKTQILPYLKLLKNPEKGEVILRANSTSRLIYILRAAANTEFPELKSWSFRKKQDHILATPKSLVMIKEIIKVDSVSSLIELIIHLINHSETAVYPNLNLNEKDHTRLMRYAESRGLTVSSENGAIKIEFPRRDENTEADRSSEG